MTLETLLESMEADGRRELAAVVAEHDRQAGAVLAAARQRAETQRRERLERAERAARHEARQVLSSARAASQAADRAALHEQLVAVRERAEQAMAELTGTGVGRAVTLRLLDEALALLPSATVCRVDPADLPAVREHRPDLHVVAADHGLGVVVADTAGREVDNTARSRLEAAWPLVRPVLVRAVSTPGSGRSSA